MDLIYFRNSYPAPFIETIYNSYVISWYTQFFSGTFGICSAKKPANVILVSILCNFKVNIDDVSNFKFEDAIKFL